MIFFLGIKRIVKRKGIGKIWKRKGILSRTETYTWIIISARVMNTSLLWQNRGLFNQLLHESNTLAALKTGSVKLVKLDTHVGGLGNLATLGRLNMVTEQFLWNGSSGLLR
jgi:hypothetical protein